MVQLSLTAGDGYLHPRYEEPKNETVVHACKPFEESVRAKQRYHELVKSTVPRAVPQLGLRASLSTGKHASPGSLLMGASPRTGGRARYHLQRKTSPKQCQYQKNGSLKMLRLPSVSRIGQPFRQRKISLTLRYRIDN